MLPCAVVASTTRVVQRSTCSTLSFNGNSDKCRLHQINGVKPSQINDAMGTLFSGEEVEMKWPTTWDENEGAYKFSGLDPRHFRFSYPISVYGSDGVLRTPGAGSSCSIRGAASDARRGSQNTLTSPSAAASRSWSRPTLSLSKRNSLKRIKTANAPSGSRQRLDIIERVIAERVLRSAIG